MDWHEIYFGPVRKADVLRVVRDPTWQHIRVNMKGRPLQEKFDLLQLWLDVNSHSEDSKIQVTNYVTALSRGGLIKREDYL